MIVLIVTITELINTTFSPNEWTKYYTDGNLRKFKIKTKTF